MDSTQKENKEVTEALDLNAQDPSGADAAADRDSDAESEVPAPEDVVSEDVVLEDDIAKDDASEEEEEVDDGREWYVIQTYSGYENKVQRNLEQRTRSMGMQDRIFRVVVPTEEEVELRNGERRTKRRRVFPGYILVQMIMDEETWYVVRNTPAVTGFVGSGDNAIPLSQEEVDAILERMEAGEPRIKVKFRVGEKVRIIEGPFSDFEGVVDDLYPERGKVRVMVSFFGRETPVEMDFLQVEKA